jgi:UDP-N-acetylmuramoyl-L-alanyl-D-glutamate--2,6-diaminopimelate ligase
MRGRILSGKRHFFYTTGISMTFTQLLAMVGSPAADIGVSADSRQIRPGDVFVAVPGVHVDGHNFIPQAVKNGAAYIVCQKAVDCRPAQMILVNHCAYALGLLSQAAQDNPSSQLTNLAVTGTNGKTTVSYLTRSVIETAGFEAGLIGTIVLSAGRSVHEAAMTTPDALTIAKAARQMVEDGAKYMVIEASSHALDQDRLAGISFTAAAFTNLTGDHLDYHKTMDDYLAAKTKLFLDLPPHAMAVLNAQSDASKKIADKCRVRILWYAIDEPADIIAHIHSMDTAGSVFSIEFNGYMEKVTTPLPGRHNISNHLAAAGLCLAAGFDLKAVTKGLSAMKNVPGRLEPVLCPAGQKAGVSVFVDYAHTDDALLNVLNTLKPLCKGRLITVFGCGGDRDKTKRPRMAAVAERLSDAIIVTSDNPRTEDPQQIIEDILVGFSDAGSRQKIQVESDRKKAIGLAISAAKRDDIILIAGKGHETYQIIGTTKTHFSDQEAAREFMETVL